MAKWLLIACLTLPLGGCGGPPVGQAVPKANTKKMAIGAAAAASAITLIDPKSAGHKPESAGEEKPKKVKKTGENVPSSVFDRLDENPEGDAEDPCKPAEPEPDDGKLEAVPKVKNENVEARERERLEKCREQQAETPPED
jgi:hypothetical protein